MDILACCIYGGQGGSPLAPGLRDATSGNRASVPSRAHIGVFMSDSNEQGRYDLGRFTLSDMIECGMRLRKIGGDAKSLEEVSGRIVRYLHDHLRDEHGERSCVLVRFFKTHAFSELEPDLQQWAEGVLGRPAESPEMKCMTLLATAGEEEPWNSRHASRRHRAIPLPSEKAVSQIPMMAQLIHQFGLPLSTVIEPQPEMLADLGQRSYNVFHVSEASGSPHIPDQESFVAPYGIRSVLAFGGMLPLGDLFAVVLFSRAHISRQTADFFQTIALNVKLPLLDFSGDRTFARSHAG